MCKEVKDSKNDICMFFKTAWKKGKVLIIDEITDLSVKIEKYFSKNKKTLITAGIICGVLYISGRKKGYKKAEKEIIKYFDKTYFANCDGDMVKIELATTSKMPVVDKVIIWD